MILRRKQLAVLGIAISVAASAQPSHAWWNAGDVPLAPATRPPDSATTIAVAPPGTEWAVVAPAEWRARSPQLVGKYVEVFGGMRTQLLINRTSSFFNEGWLIDSTDREVGQVLFDQAADEVLSWIRKAKCDVGCQQVFIRGIVADVSTPRARDRSIALRVIEVSNESKTGTPVAGSAALGVLSATDLDARKPLLPLGGLPGKGGTVPLSATSAASPDTATKKGRLMRWLKSAVIAQPGTSARGSAAPQEGVFRFGDPPITETAYRNIRDTELYKIFANAPWNSTHTMWPRVAIIIEGHQKGGTNDLTYTKLGDEVKNGSWRLWARIWTGPAASRDVAPFNWCLTEMHYDTLSDRASNATYVRVAFMDLPLWGTTPKSMMSDQNTGAKVTTGPNPPYLPAAKFEYRGPSQADVIMLGNLMRDMGFSYGVPDGRVWIVDASEP